MGWLADVLNDPLKAIVEQGYDRSWLPAAPQGATPDDISVQGSSSQPAALKLVGQAGGLQHDDRAGDALENDTPAPSEIVPDTPGSDAVPPDQDEVAIEIDATDEDDPAIDAETETQSAAVVEMDLPEDGALSGEAADETQLAAGQESTGSSGKAPVVSGLTDGTAVGGDDSAGASVPRAVPSPRNGPKHRLPRTSLRGKLFDKPAKDAGSTTVAKPSGSSSGASGDAGTGGSSATSSAGGNASE